MADGKDETPWTPAGTLPPNIYPPLPETSDEERVAHRQALARLNALYAPNLTEQQAEDAIALYPDLPYEDAILRYMQDIGGKPSGGGRTAAAEPAFELTPEQQLVYSRLNTELSPNLTMADVKAALAYYGADVSFEDALTRWAEATGRTGTTPELTPAQGESARAWQLVFGGTMAEAGRAVHAYEAEGISFEEAVANQQLRDLNTSARAISASQGVTFERALGIMQEAQVAQQAEKERLAQVEITRQDNAATAALSDEIDRQLAASGAPDVTQKAVDRDTLATQYVAANRAAGGNLSPNQFLGSTDWLDRAAEAGVEDFVFDPEAMREAGYGSYRRAFGGYPPGLAFALSLRVQRNITALTGARTAAEFATVGKEGRAGQWAATRPGEGIVRGTVGGVPVERLAWGQTLQRQNPELYAQAQALGWQTAPRLPVTGWRQPAAAPPPAVPPPTIPAPVLARGFGAGGQGIAPVRAFGAGSQGIAAGPTLARGMTIRPPALNIAPLPSIRELGRALAAPPTLRGMGRQLNPVATALRLGQMRVGR